jgi:hypothetical protein
MDETLGAPSIERLLLDGWETTNLEPATVSPVQLFRYQFIQQRRVRLTL